MAGIKEILDIVRAFSPESGIQPGFSDNVGLAVGSERGETDIVLACLDVTENVVAEAAILGAKLILSHHPLIFNPILSVTDESHTGRVILNAARQGIAVYSAHTNLDFCPGGINDYNAQLIGMQNIQPMESDGGVAVGRVGDIKPIPLSRLTKAVGEIFNDKWARYTGDGEQLIKRVAVINGGAGRPEYIDKAIRLKADCYISADFPHHALIMARESGISLIQLQHYSMEHIYINKWTEVLSSLAVAAGMNVKFTASKSELAPTQTEEL